MKLTELQTWLIPTEVAKKQRISHQAVIRRLEEGKHYRGVKTKQGWLIDPSSVKESK